MDFAMHLFIPNRLIKSICDFSFIKIVSTISDKSINVMSEDFIWERISCLLCNKFPVYYIGFPKGRDQILETYNYYKVSFHKEI